MLLGLTQASPGTMRLLAAASERLEPAALLSDNPTVATSIAAAAVAIVAWTGLPLALGAWRTCTRDA